MQSLLIFTVSYPNTKSEGNSKHGPAKVSFVTNLLKLKLFYKIYDLTITIINT